MRLFRIFTACMIALTGLFITNSVHAACLPSMTQKVDDVLFVAFDTETTGFSSDKERIIEIGCVKVKHGKIIDTKEWLINPHHHISKWATKAHGITYDMVKGHPSFEDIYPEFIDYIKGAVLIAHNAPFDVRFIRAEALRNELTPPCEGCIDSLHLLRNWYPDEESHTIGHLADVLNIEGGLFHRATSDSVYTVKLINKGMETRPLMNLNELVDQAGGLLLFEKEK